MQCAGTIFCNRMINDDLAFPRVNSEMFKNSELTFMVEGV